MPNRDPSNPSLSRRSLLGGTAALATASLAPSAGADEPASLAAKPPAGFKPMTKTGRIVKVTKGNDFPSLMQPNLLWPKADVAKNMVERALMELTGAPNLVEALGKFIHKDDVVAIKPNGIAGQSGATMAANAEVVMPIIHGLIALGVPPEKITVYEQFPSYMKGTRIGGKGNKLPAGVKTGIHMNSLVAMPETVIYKNVKTQYVKFLTEATAVIDVTQIKDHSICGFTGCLKNMTHGSITNPGKHHGAGAHAQIAALYNHEIMRSRVRLHIVDAFKIMYDKGPLDKDPKRRIPYGAVFATTDPVAMDTIGWKIVDNARKENGMKSLAQVGREPKFIAKAADLGLGAHAESKIKLSEVAL
ncbi:MAG: DUF362 domain-containing protein [Myxococcales bacterium]|nr:DUF362 domain-containing protein [Myxococcales bacterium]